MVAPALVLAEGASWDVDPILEEPLRNWLAALQDSVAAVAAGVA